MTMAAQKEFECGGCGQQGIPSHGEKTCHCSGCYRSFQGLDAFDRHRRLGRCVLDGEWWSQDRDGIWHWLPGEYRSAEQWLALAKARAEQARLRIARFGFGRKEGGER